MAKTFCGKNCDECTYKEEEEEEAEIDSSALADMINNIFDQMEEIIDTALLEYSASGDNGLSISAFTVSMNVGAKDRIGILSVPSGYTMADIVITSSNPECVRVDGEGNITAVSEGMATIWVSTSDGQYSAACSVISWGSLAVEFTPLDDMPALKWEVA